MRSAFRSALLVCVPAAFLLGLFACGAKKDANDPSQVQGQTPQGQYAQPQGQYPQQQYPQGQYTQPTATTQPVATTQPAATAAPAGGVPCQTDNDPQCLFGRCLSGKCGACASAADCKAGSSCVQTPLGMACAPAMPGAQTK